MGGVLVSHLSALPGAHGVKIFQPAERLAKLDIQGPAAPAIVRGLLADPSLFASLPYFAFKGDFDLARTDVKLADGTPILLSRSGYTGEAGFEIFAPLDRALPLWNAVGGAGEPLGLVPCGLAARDTLRVGAVLPLSHQDIGPWPFINNPWSFALPLAPGGNFSKKFLGSDALNPDAAPHTQAFVGFDHEFAVDAIARDILKRPFVTVGFAAFVLLVPLAATSSNRAIRWLGGRRWQDLHRAVYPVAILGCLHYLWLVKATALLWPIAYSAAVALLLGWRVREWRRKAIPVPRFPDAKPLKFFSRRPD
jgi:hypothetical protein